MPLVVKTDVPRSTLHLAWTGLPPALLLKIIFSAGLASLGYFSPIFLIVVAIVVLIIELVRRHSPMGTISYGYWSVLHWDGPSATLFLRHSGLYMWGWRNYKIPFSSMKRIRMTIGPDLGKDLEMKCSIELEAEPAITRYLRFTFSVKGLDKRAEAMELLFRIAKVLRWETYLVERSDPQLLLVSLSQQSQPGGQSIPLEGTNLDFQSDASLQKFQDPETKVDPFVPGRFVARPTEAKHDIEWLPGRRIRIASSALQFEDVWTEGLRPAVFAGVLAGVVAPIVLEVTDVIAKTPSSLIQSVIGVAAGAIAFFLGVRSTLRKNQEKEVIFDWNNLSATIRHGKDVRSFPLRDMREIVLVNDETYVPGGKRQSGYTLYGACVLAVYQNGSEEIAKTIQFREDKDSPYLMALPMAVELARALSIPYRWLPSVSHSRRSTGLRSILSLISFLAFVGFIFFVLGAPTFDFLCRPLEIESVLVIPSESGTSTSGQACTCTVIGRSGIGRGFKQPVKLSCIGLPNGFQCVFSINPVVHPYSEGSQLTVLAPQDAIAQTFVIEVEAESKSSHSSDRVTVTVKK